MRGLWRKAQYLSEIVVQSNQHTPLIRAHMKNRLIMGATETLFTDCHHIVPLGTKEILTAPPDIFIEFEFHAAFSKGTEMIRSRAASAP